MVSLLKEGFKKNNIKNASISFIAMYRQHLITKEEWENIYKKKSKEDRHGDEYGDSYIGEESINDDLEDIIMKIKSGMLETEWKRLYFIPMLTAEEKKLIENEDTNYLKLYAEYLAGNNPDVPDEEMKLSESKSKFCYSSALRVTYIFENFNLVHKLFDYQSAT